MKKTISILAFIIPVLVFAQQNLDKSSPLDYMWMNVGNTGFSAGPVDFPTIAFSPTGEPYVSYTDSVNSNYSTVMKFDGSTWVNVGPAGFSNDYTSQPS